MDVDGAPGIAVEAGVEKSGRILQRGPFARVSAPQQLKPNQQFFTAGTITPRLDYVGVGQKSITDLKSFEGHSMAVSQVGAVSQIVPLLTAFNLVVSGLIHFFVLWWAFNRYSSPVEKAKRNGALRAEDVIAMMNEDELAALRERLMPPSQRSI